MKILIVDDEPSLRQVLSDLVELQGHQVVTAEDGEAGFRVFCSECPDMILSDIKMPKSDGIEFLSKVRDHDQSCIFVIVTGLGDSEYLLQALRGSANDFLQKPIIPGVLSALIEKYAGIIESRSRMHAILNPFVRRSFQIQLRNCLETVPDVVERLLRETGNFLEASEVLGTRIGLVELIVNAIEHGNLEISYEQKQDALNKGINGIDMLYAARLENKGLTRRLVTVDFTMTRQLCEWTISDEGAGFDYSTLPDPLSQKNLSQPSGRGIFLARMHFDEVEFKGKGNVVTVRKLLKKVCPG